MQLATDIVLLAAKDTYDLALLVAGDADFVDAVQGVKDLGKHVGVLAFTESIARDLRQASDFFVEISKEFVTGEDSMPHITVL